MQVSAMQRWECDGPNLFQFPLSSRLGYSSDAFICTIPSRERRQDQKVGMETIPMFRALRSSTISRLSHKGGDVDSRKTVAIVCILRSRLTEGGKDANG